MLSIFAKKQCAEITYGKWRIYACKADHNSAPYAMHFSLQQLSRLQLWGVSKFGMLGCRGSKRDSTFDNILKRPLKFPSEPSTSADCQVDSYCSVHPLVVYMVIFRQPLR